MLVEVDGVAALARARLPEALRPQRVAVLSNSTTKMSLEPFDESVFVPKLRSTPLNVPVTAMRPEALIDTLWP